MSSCSTALTPHFENAAQRNIFAMCSTMTAPRHSISDESSSESSGSSEDLSDRDNLVVKHLGLVKTIAANIRGGLPSFIALEDLMQAGTLGLIDAAYKFSPEKQVPFYRYAKHRIRAAILDSLRKNDETSRDTRLWRRRIQDANTELTTKLERDPDVAVRSPVRTVI